jgi:hypothetical protein
VPQQARLPEIDNTRFVIAVGIAKCYSFHFIGSVKVTFARSINGKMDRNVSPLRQFLTNFYERHALVFAAAYQGAFKMKRRCVRPYGERAWYMASLSIP